MGFWDKNGNGGKPAVAPAQQQGWWQPEQAPARPEPGVVPQQQAPVGWQPPPGLAVRTPQLDTQARESALAEAQGYVDKGPTWMRVQPTEVCPSCGEPTYAAISENGYGSMTRKVGRDGSVAEFQHKQCFSCGYPMRGEFSGQFVGVKSNAPVNGAARQVHDLGQNFGASETMQRLMAQDG